MGFYIVWCNVHPTFCRENVQRREPKNKEITESHALVCDSDFNTFNGKKFYGVIIRKYSYLRAFSLDDIRDVGSTRNSLESFRRENSHL